MSEADGTTTGRGHQCAACEKFKKETIAWGGEDSPGPRICRHCYVMGLRGDAETNRLIPRLIRDANLALADALESGEAGADFDELDSQEFEEYIAEVAKYERDSAAALRRTPRKAERSG